MAPLSVFAAEPIEIYNEPGYLVIEPEQMILNGIGTDTSDTSFGTYANFLAPWVTDPVKIVVNAGKDCTANFKFRIAAPAAHGQYNLIVKNLATNKTEEKLMADALTDNWVYNDLEMTVDLLKGNNEITVNVQGNEENNAPTVLLDHIAVELEPGYTVYQDEVFESVNGSYSSKNDDVVAGKLYTGNSAMNLLAWKVGLMQK